MTPVLQLAAVVVGAWAVGHLIAAVLVCWEDQEAWDEHVTVALDIAEEYR
jgi:hypothetical protein